MASPFPGAGSAGEHRQPALGARPSGGLFGSGLAVLAAQLSQPGDGLQPARSSGGQPSLMQAGGPGHQLGLGLQLQGHIGSVSLPGASAPAGGGGADAQSMLATGWQQLQQLLNGNPVLAAALPSLALPYGPPSLPTQQATAAALALALQQADGPAADLPARNHHGPQVLALQGPIGVGHGPASAAVAPPSVSARGAVAAASTAAGAAAPSSMADTQGRGKKRKKSDVPEAEPAKKRGLNGYNVFSSEYWRQVRDVNGPVVASRDRPAFIAEEWAKLGPEVKAAYNARAETMNAEARKAKQ
ncbi:hypothetical protein PLESTB_001488800 [Pleodorina starrii]|uniref:HMG box domain-containing protein n=1 Tax=Pleodorina starrii TaxID=330485 RepID=A0A9W6BX35_9CHLO|nr:hypothetical protein PLESTB_001488800 [Pleodorina starrii]